MRQEVTVHFAPGDEIVIAVAEPLPADIARRWLDDQFIAFDCEPLRASGKVLTADKVLAIPATAGRTPFEDPAWAAEFANAVAGAMGRGVVRVDLMQQRVIA